MIINWFNFDITKVVTLFELSKYFTTFFDALINLFKTY